MCDPLPWESPHGVVAPRAARSADSGVATCWPGTQRLAPPPPPGAAGVAREKPVTTASGVGFLGIQAMLASRFPFLSSSGPPLLWSEERGGSCHSPVSGPLDEALGGLGRGGGGGEKTSPTSKNGDRDGT